MKALCCTMGVVHRISSGPENKQIMQARLVKRTLQKGRKGRQVKKVTKFIWETDLRALFVQQTELRESRDKLVKLVKNMLRADEDKKKVSCHCRSKLQN